MLNVVPLAVAALALSQWAEPPQALLPPPGYPPMASQFPLPGAAHDLQPWPAADPLALPPPPGYAPAVPPPWDIGPAADERVHHEAYDAPLAEDGWWQPLAPRFGATSASFTWLAPGQGRSSFGIADFDLNRTWTRPIGEAVHPLLITPGVGLHLWAGPPRLDLPPRVYDLYLDLSWRFLDRGWWSLAGGLTPGFYGDFARIDGEAFQLTGWLLGDWTLGERWSVLAGIAYVQQLKSNLLPIGGVIWRPTPDARFDIVIPRPRIAHRWHQDADRDVWLYVGGLFGGGAWAVDAGSDNVLVQYSDLRLSLGCEIARAGGRITTLEIGYVFERDIALDRFTVVKPPSTILFSAALAF